MDIKLRLMGYPVIDYLLGVDWLILSILLSVFIFMFLEKLFPKYKNQVILRKEWSLDFFIFVLTIWRSLQL